MQTKAPPPVESLPAGAVPPVVRLYFELNQLKQLYRQGWLRRGVLRERCESVAEHTWSVAMLALVLTPAHTPALDLERVLRMALIHDAGEIHAGDMTPADEVPPAEKHRLEEASVRRLFELMPEGEQYVRLWQEYEDDLTPEARFVRELDRLDMAMQAAVYGQQGLIDPAEFYDSAARVIATPDLRALLDGLRSLEKP